MNYVYSGVDDLKGKPKVGTQECVALIRRYTNAGPTALWRRGPDVAGNLAVSKGTAIATFVNGRYLSLSHGNHAAFFVRQGLGGIYIMDQWRSKNKKSISEHFIKSKGMNADGTFKDPSNNADAFSVIER
ncbi:BPSL0067 family protein [Rugamonas sp.]|uniref:BPSL0067 family protein n=1 Tax=Rugamonas sp. TaxID=1926287 RepID=UPI0025EBAA12|nr:BPSL0067 family protein [Rugamonas sp.]